MKIRLNEIPAEGRSYHFTRETGELNKDLEDLVHELPYDVAFTIRPIGNAYEMRGKLKAQLTEACSKCGYDFDLPVEKTINEILFEGQEEDHRKGHSVHGNQSVDFLGEGPSMFEVTGDIFDPGEYTHEVVALAEPFYPTCAPNGDCYRKEEVEETLARLEAESEKAVEAKAANPFAVLQGLDLKKSDQ